MRLMTKEEIQANEGREVRVKRRRENLDRNRDFRGRSRRGRIKKCYPFHFLVEFKYSRGIIRECFPYCQLTCSSYQGHEIEISTVKKRRK